MTELALGDRKNMAYAGTAATYGRGRGLVVATGMNTEFGKIAQMLQAVETGKTPLQENLDRVGRTLAKAALVIVGVIVAVGLFRGQPFIEMLVFGIALAVAVVPEALPAVVTISLAIGVQRMVKRHALVRRLLAVETLGSTSVICSDKTGTIDERRDDSPQHPGGRDICWTSPGPATSPRASSRRMAWPRSPRETRRRMLQAAALASDARIVRGDADGRWSVKGDPTEGALVVAAAKAGLDKLNWSRGFLV